MSAGTQVERLAKQRRLRKLKRLYLRDRSESQILQSSRESSVSGDSERESLEGEDGNAEVAVAVDAIATTTPVGALYLTNARASFWEDFAIGIKLEHPVFC